jgi:hypothetical protein
MSNIQYAEKLNSPLWHRRRQEIIDRDGGKCKLCLSRDYLQVHHLGYILGADPWQYPDDFLITLCEKCHSREEAFKKLIKDEIRSISICGIPNEEIYKHLVSFKPNSNG